MHEISWGFLIVLYLFLAGVSAGAFATSATVLLTQGAGQAARYRSIGLWGAMLAPFPATIGTGLLVLDLGRPLAFYWLFTRLRLTSPMSFGVWFLSAFLLLSVIYFFLWLPQTWRATVARFLPHGWRAGAAAAEEGPAGAGLQHTRRLLAGIGLPFALGVAIYTAILLGASTRPLWGSPLMPFLFLFSAMSTGLAAVMVAVLLARLLTARFAGRLAASAGAGAVTTGAVPAGTTVPSHSAAQAETAAAAAGPLAAPNAGAAHDPAMHLLLVSDLALLGLELTTLLLMILYSRIGTLASRQSWDVMLSGQYAWTFWLGPVLTGILAPLALEVLELRHAAAADGHGSAAKVPGPALGLLTGTLILVGGFLLRYAIVYAGQAFTWAPH